MVTPDPRRGDEPSDPDDDLQPGSPVPNDDHDQPNAFPPDDDTAPQPDDERPPS